MNTDSSKEHSNKDHNTDYALLGFKCGIEIHQQLDGKKLFCNCPCDIKKGKPDYTVKRWLRASAGETGEVDKAASFEQQKLKYYLYHVFKDSTCLIELDEEPPMHVNQAALNTCLKVCKLLNVTVGDQIQFMRKVVVDGSNCSGFQRTALVGRNGFITLVNGKKISIESVCLEEEACQPIERLKTHDVYNLSRQGIPLIEIATGPDISSAEEAKETSAKLGMILRSVDGMKRGIGTIRQDVNVSIKGGARVEIKGFQEFKSIPKVIEYEVKRHMDLIKNGKKVEMHVRGHTPDFKTVYQRPMPGASRMYPETDIPIVLIDMSKIKTGVTLEQKETDMIHKFGLRNELAKEIVKRNIDMTGLAGKFKNIDANFLAETIINVPKEIKSRYKKDISVLDHLDVIEILDQGKIPKSAVFEILTELAQGKKVDYSRYKSVDAGFVEKIVKDVVANDPDAPIGALMGQAMAKLRGKADGKIVMELLKKYKGA
ncbi:MAG: Glu-tRNA(Gln) amidotransferase subunit GatE [Nanoarchaeota archaeon]|nr:Glu-tRNA(Gln) amidotransferase subunit GatE [Nanoarchaeota archaeon]